MSGLLLRPTACRRRPDYPRVSECAPPSPAADFTLKPAGARRPPLHVPRNNSPRWCARGSSGIFLLRDRDWSVGAVYSY
eukprot:287297-Pyramimonas_sp.AAC.1